MADSRQLLRAGRRLLGSAGTRTRLPSDGWRDPAFDLFGGVAAGFNSRAEEVLLSGPAGTGKTLANLLRVYWVCRRYPGARTLIVRKTRESLTETVLVTWERDVLGPDHPLLTRRPILTRVRQAYQFPNRSQVVLGGMDKPDKVLSSEWDVIYCPEATELTLVDWETLGGRLRSGRVPYQQIIADCNPTTPTHWLYQRQAKGLVKLVPTTHRDNPRFWDRGAGDWTDDGRKYLARLGRMTGARRKRFLEGVWAAAEGLVYDGYDPGVHLLPADWTPPADWPRIWSLDWGYYPSPVVLQFWALDPENRVHHYREFYRTRVTVDQLGEWAKAEVEHGREPRPVAVVSDHEPEKAERFGRAAGVIVTPAEKFDKLAGIQAVQERFDRAAGGRPRIYFKPGALAHEPDPALVDEGRPTCTLDELLGYIWDTRNPNRPKDLPMDLNDHGCDAMLYACRKADSDALNPIRPDSFAADYAALERPFPPGVF